MVCIIIEKEFIQDRKLAIVRNSKKEKIINALRNKISDISLTNIHNHDKLEKYNSRVHFYYREALVQIFQICQYYQVI